MNYYNEWDIPSNYIISSSSSLDTSTIEYTYSDVNSNCHIIDASSYKDYISTKTFILITDGEYLRIYHAACKINLTIYVVGSRANGTATEISDWDYIIEGLTNKKWKSIRNSIPGAKTIDQPMKIDIMHTPLDESKPYIAISPYTLLNRWLTTI